MSTTQHLKKISADIRQHIVGRWQHDGDLSFKNVEIIGSTATANFPSADYERPEGKDTLDFAGDGTLIITLEGQEPVTAAYSVPEPEDVPDGVEMLRRVAEIKLTIPEGTQDFFFVELGAVSQALFEPDYKTLYLYNMGEYWRYRRIE